jgi:predicted nucleotidyltransferase
LADLVAVVEVAAASEVLAAAVLAEVAPAAVGSAEAQCSSDQFSTINFRRPGCKIIHSVRSDKHQMTENLSPKITDKTDEFVKRCREAAGPNVEAIILFGSAVSGDFHPGLSDLNLFVVLRDGSFSVLQSLSPVAKWWNGEKQPPPLCMTRRELERSTDVFAIELLDMVQHHRVLFGEDVLKALHISTHLHRIQVEYELREKLILLRQHLLLAAGDSSGLWDVVLHSVPSFATLFRHALIALGSDSPASRREAVEKLSQKIGFDPSPLQQALDVRQRKADPKKLDVNDLCARYLAAIEKVADAVDESLDTTSGSKPSIK